MSKEGEEFLDDLREGLASLKAYRRGEDGVRVTTLRRAEAGETEREYLAVFERAPLGWAASVPDLPGCGASAPTLEEAESRIRQAISLYLYEMREAGRALPEPTAVVRTFAIAI